MVIVICAGNKVKYVTSNQKGERAVGMESSDGGTRTFDHFLVALVLVENCWRSYTKSLAKAIEDGMIYMQLSRKCCKPGWSSLELLHQIHQPEKM